MQMHFIILNSLPLTVPQSNINLAPEHRTSPLKCPFPGAIFYLHGG